VNFECPVYRQRVSRDNRGMGNVRFATARSGEATQDAARSIAGGLRTSLGGEEPSIVWLFASTAQPLGELAAEVTKAFPRAVVLGASTAGEFTESGDSKKSVSAAAVAGDFRVFAGMGTGLGASTEKAVEAALAELPRSVPDYPFATAVILLDPLVGKGEEASMLVATSLPDGVRLVGGAAGDDLAMKQTHVSLGARAASDALVVALIYSKQPLGIGVLHAHEPFSRPLVVTRASGSTVHEIDGRPAWDVWREVTKERAKARGIDVDAIAPGDEVKYLLVFEGALLIGGQNYKIRAPLARTPEGALNFACGIAQGATIRVSESIPDRQVAAARDAARIAGAELDGQVSGAVVFDCICRNIILGDTFGDAVRGMSQELGGAPLAGFETYGEVALDVGDMSGFHNTTTVVLAFPRSA